jgi:hypothetical protein
MNYDSITSAFKSVTDIDKAIKLLQRKAKILRKSAVNASTLADKLTINEEIKNINGISFKLKMNYFELEDVLNKRA